MRPRPLLLAVVGAVALTFVLSSCASIPTNGAVEDTTPTAVSSADEFIRVLARPPANGATRSEIVAGFLAASASFDGDHAVARTYLTSAASSAWVPGSHVSVYESMPGYRLDAGAASSVTMTALRAAGSISARGQFFQPLTSGPFTEHFTLRKVGDQWRIATLPQGLVLSTGDVDRAYRSVNIYFVNQARTVLVPDPLFLPTEQPGIATTLVRDLLAGPTPWLAPAVTTGFPAGTSLAVDSVPVTNGIARVDLDPSALTATDSARQSMAAQLAYLVQQLDGVAGVRITVHGVPLSIPSAGDVTRESDWPTFDPAARPLDPTTYVVAGQSLSSVVGSKTRAVDGYFGHTTGLRVAGTALDGTEIAGGYGRDGAEAVRVGPAGATSVSTVYRGGHVSSLSWDRADDVWIVDTGTGHAGVWIALGIHHARRVRVQGLAGRTVRVLRVSRDGSRAALIVGSSPSAPGELLLGRVVRSGDGATVLQLSGPRRVESALDAVDDVGWADATSLLVSGREAGATRQTYLVDVGGLSVSPTGSVPQLESVAACPGRPYLAGTVDGQIWSDRGSGWRTYVRATLPIYPG